MLVIRFYQILSPNWRRQSHGLVRRLPCESFLSRRMASGREKPKHRNRLSLEKSPYLLQHASNPVDWYPWGEEAIQKAKAENKPIFLSVGYSTCHWCHVMERESFENEEIGAYLSENFVCVKVDREERPDVDRVYMTFIQALSGGGGWPMSVWMTPDLKPFYGGTYFPPENRYFGKPGFRTLLETISKKWQEDGEKLVEQSSAIVKALSQSTAPGHTGEIPGQEAITKCFSMLDKSFDKEMGGFGRAPKFPQPVNCSFLLRLWASEPGTDMGERAREMTEFTLRRMAKGGIHDHVGQGFHRYSTDAFWHVPHFEKMLYDQAQLAVLYTEAFQATGDPVFADVTRDILLYVTRDLSNPCGGFYSAEDADSLLQFDGSEKKEGAFNVWSQGEITTLLPQKVEGHPDLAWAKIISKHFDVREEGNVAPYQDPHDELKHKNVLIERGSIEETAEHFKISVEEARSVVDSSLKIMFTEREKRPRPHRDDKMVAAWNGLMLSGFARAGPVLGEPRYTSRALQAANFLREHMFVKEKGRLLRTCYVGEEAPVSQIAKPIEGFVDDYAFVIRGLLDLYEACFDEQWIEWAAQLQEQQDVLFWDEDEGGYYTSQAGDTNIILRMKDDHDGAEPSSNSVSASNLLRLASLLNRAEWRDKAASIFRLFSDRISKIPMAVPELVSALMNFRCTPRQIIIAGDRSGQDTQDLLRCVNSQLLPQRTLVVWEGEEHSYLEKHLKVLSSLHRLQGKATAFVCENYTCFLPVNTPEELNTLLKEGKPPPAGL